jgi:hypothetical protein
MPAAFSISISTLLQASNGLSVFSFHRLQQVELVRKLVSCLDPHTQRPPIRFHLLQCRRFENSLHLHFAHTRAPFIVSL